VLWKHKTNPDSYRRHVTVAVRENQILERYFPRTLAASGQIWPAAEWEPLLPHVRTDRRYKSEVSRHLITHFSERQIWLMILVLLLADLILLLLRGRDPAPVVPA